MTCFLCCCGRETQSDVRAFEGFGEAFFSGIKARHLAGPCPAQSAPCSMCGASGSFVGTGSGQVKLHGADQHISWWDSAIPGVHLHSQLMTCGPKAAKPSHVCRVLFSVNCLSGFLAHRLNGCGWPHVHTPGRQRQACAYQKPCPCAHVHVLCLVQLPTTWGKHQSHSHYYCFIYHSLHMHRVSLLSC